MTEINLERLLNEPIYAFNFKSMIGSIREFLEFSEANIENQYIEECRSIHQRADSGELNLPDEYRDSYVEHLLENTEHWFTVGLPLQIRYAALLSLITAVEWSIGQLNKQLIHPINKKPRGNLTVHRLYTLNQKTQRGKMNSIDNYKALVEVRNCIVHNAGLERGYKFPNALEQSLDRLEGIYLDNLNLYGTHVCIEREALNQYIDEIGETVVVLHEAADNQDLLKSL